MSIRNAIQQQQAGNIQGYWPFDDASQPSGGSIAAVIGSDLEVFGTNVFEVAGQEGNAVRFNGTSGYAFQPSSLGATIDDHTVCLWFNTSDDGTLLSFASESNTIPLYEVTLTGGAIGVFVRAATGNEIKYNVTGLGAGLADGQWHFLAVRHNGTDWVVQVDNVTLNQTTEDAGVDGIERLGIAARARASVMENIDATIQHVAIWSTALTNDELTNQGNRI